MDAEFASDLHPVLATNVYSIMDEMTKKAAAEGDSATLNALT